MVCEICFMFTGKVFNTKMKLVVFPERNLLIYTLINGIKRNHNLDSCILLQYFQQTIIFIKN